MRGCSIVSTEPVAWFPQPFGPTYRCSSSGCRATATAHQPLLGPKSCSAHLLPLFMDLTRTCSWARASGTAWFLITGCRAAATAPQALRAQSPTSCPPPPLIHGSGANIRSLVWANTRWSMKLYSGAVWGITDLSSSIYTPPHQPITSKRGVC